MKLSRFTHFKSNLNSILRGIDGYICGWICGRDLEFPKYIEVNSRTCLLLEQGLAYMSGRGIYDGSFDSK